MKEFIHTHRKFSSCKTVLSLVFYDVGEVFYDEEEGLGPFGNFLSLLLELAILIRDFLLHGH